MIRFNWENETTKRAFVGLCYLLGIVLALSLRQWTVYLFDAIVIILVWFCVFEVYRAKKLNQHGVRDFYLYPYLTLAYLVFVMGIHLTPAFTWWLHLVMQIVLIFVLAIYVYFMAYTDKEIIKQAKLKKTTPGKLAQKTVLEYLKILLYPALILLTLVPINHLDGWSVAPVGLFALLLVFVITIFADTCAYIVGRLLGGPKLCPKISPKKTISGFIGGLFGSTLGALLVLLIMSSNQTLADFLTENVGNAAAVNLFVALVGFAGGLIVQGGDLIASMVKRRHNIKDFGKWLPGHGGLMDRVDGLMFNSLFIFIVFLFVVF